MRGAQDVVSSGERFEFLWNRHFDPDELVAGKKSHVGSLRHLMIFACALRSNGTHLESRTMVDKEAYTCWLDSGNTVVLCLEITPAPMQVHLHNGTPHIDSALHSGRFSSGGGIGDLFASPPRLDSPHQS